MTNKEILNAYVGDTQVEKIYLGADVVWPTTPPEPIYSAMPLTFEIISGGTIVWSNNANNGKTIYYSKNNGEWTQITSATGDSAPVINVTAGDKVRFKGNNANYSEHYGNDNHSCFSASSTAIMNINGNILSLCYGDDFLSAATYPNNFQSFGLFSGLHIILAKDLIIPDIVVEKCCRNMFSDCTSLTQAPELPAATLPYKCYDSMFYGCSSLNYIKCLATDISSNQSLLLWVADVSPTGTFVKHPNATWPTGNSGIPSGWTVKDADI